MLKIISWNQYFLFAGVATAAWYAYVLLRYAARPAGSKPSSFSIKDRTALFGGQQELPAKEHFSGEDAESMEAPEIEGEEAPDWGLVTQTVMQEIKSSIAEAAGLGVSDEEVIAQVRVLLSNYPELKQTAYGSMVTECIVREGQAVGFDWTNEEVGGFWN